MRGRFTRLPGLLVVGFTVFVLLTVASLFVVRRENRVVCDAILDNRNVLRELVEYQASAPPVSPSEVPPALREFMASSQARAEDFQAFARRRLADPPQCQIDPRHRRRYTPPAPTELQGTQENAKG